MPADSKAIHSRQGEVEKEEVIAVGLEGSEPLNPVPDVMHVETALFQVRHDHSGDFSSIFND
jgi:hypothetical protein